MNNRVVVTGIGMITPVGLDTESSWMALTSGKSGIAHITSFDAEGFDTKIAAEVKGFDPSNYLDRKAAKNMDRFAQFAVVASLEALNQSGLRIEGGNSSDVAVRIGSGVGGILTISEQMGVLQERDPIG